MKDCKRASSPGVRILVALLAAVLCGACSTNVYLTHSDCSPADGLRCVLAGGAGLDTGSVAVSVFLVGDAGYGEDSLRVAQGQSLVQARELLLRKLASDLEASSRIASDVRLVYLGDNIYPNGLRDGTGRDGSCRGSPYCDHDQEQLEAQIGIVPDAVTGYFVAGNHDWANTTGDAAYGRLVNQGRYLSNEPVDLLPPAGCPGPEVRDVSVRDTTRLRFGFLDTQWLLLPGKHRPNQDSDPPPPCPGATEDQVYDDLQRRLAELDDVPVILLAHHPARTYSRHAGHGNGMSKVVYLLGWSAQDLNTRPYKRLIDRLETVLADVAAGTSAPVVFAAGHDHALQVMHDSVTGVHYLVSGSGSKLSDVGRGDDSEFAAGLPGYMRLDVLTSGTVLLYVTAGCPPTDDEPVGREVEHDGGLKCTVGEFDVAFVRVLN